MKQCAGGDQSQTADGQISCLAWVTGMEPSSQDKYATSKAPPQKIKAVEEATIAPTLLCLTSKLIKRPGASLCVCPMPRTQNHLVAGAFTLNDRVRVSRFCKREKERVSVSQHHSSCAGAINSRCWWRQLGAASTVANHNHTASSHLDTYWHCRCLPGMGDGEFNL